MLNLTTFEAIGERYNLPDDIIDKMTEFYLKDCFSHKNTMSYYTKRYYFYINSDYHNHRIKMSLVDSEFKYYIRKYFSYKNRVLNIFFDNLNMILFNILGYFDNDEIDSDLYNRNLEFHFENLPTKFPNFIKNN
jgi:hypothetical protein